MSKTMTHDELVEALKHRCLQDVADMAEVSVRTLQKLVSGKTTKARLGTIALVQPVLRRVSTKESK